MGKVPRKNVENVKSIDMNYLKQRPRFYAILNQIKLSRKTRQQMIKNLNYMGNNPNADLNFNSIIETTQNNDNSIVIDKLENIITETPLDIIDTTVQSSSKSNSTVSLNPTISFPDNVQMIDHVSTKPPIECIIISDDSDEEFIKQRNKKPMLEEKITTNIYKQKISQNNRQLKHRNVKIFQKTNVPSTLKETVKTNKQLRPIIIDGLNIGHVHGGGKFSAKGIEICIQYFVNKGHQKVLAFIPHHRQGPAGSISNTILNSLYKIGHICYTPSRKVQNLRMTCYTKRIILNYAHQCGGVVVSNDNYKDLYEEKESFKDIIENRQVMFTFVGNAIIVPDDQYNGKLNIRTLSDILCFPE